MTNDMWLLAYVLSVPVAFLLLVHGHRKESDLTLGIATMYFIAAAVPIYGFVMVMVYTMVRLIQKRDRVIVKRYPEERQP